LVGVVGPRHGPAAWQSRGVDAARHHPHHSRGGRAHLQSFGIKRIAQLIDCSDGPLRRSPHSPARTSGVAVCTIFGTPARLLSRRGVDRRRRSLHPAIVVTGRYGDPPTLRRERPELPFARFLERPRVYYPAVELIADADLSTQSDPYLNDHVFQGTPLLPAVMGLEAMAQVAIALCGPSQPPIFEPVFENVRFSRPVHIPDGASVTVRLAALVRSPGVVEVVLRTSETAFQVDHFRAVCRFGTTGLPSATHPISYETLPIDPGRDLYGSILFQSGRFRRLRAYHRLRATECIAEIAPGGAGDWFARYLPATLALGDPGARDAVIHSVQACIPHATVLPIGVERIIVATADEPGPGYVHAHEIGR